MKDANWGDPKGYQPKVSTFTNESVGNILTLMVGKSERDYRTNSGLKTFLAEAQGLNQVELYEALPSCSLRPSKVKGTVYDCRDTSKKGNIEC
jgi:hypothetical protein